MSDFNALLFTEMAPAPAQPALSPEDAAIYDQTPLTPTAVVVVAPPAVAPPAAAPAATPAAAPPAAAPAPRQALDPKNTRDQLAIAISGVVVDELRADNEVLKKTMALIVRSIAQLQAAVMISTGPAGAKRAVAPRATRTGGGAAEPDESKVKNAMLYMRWRYLREPDYREACKTPPAELIGMTPEALAGLLANDSTTVSKPVGAANRLSAEARIIWKSGMSENQHKNMKTEFETWRQARDAAGSEAPLSADGTGMVAAVAAPMPAAQHTAVVTADAFNQLLGEPAF
jgi:hypothetical protein